jgi:hypothetical protein
MFQGKPQVTEAAMRHLTRKTLTASQVEMRELDLEQLRWPGFRTLLLALALADVTATTLTLLSH